MFGTRNMKILLVLLCWLTFYVCSEAWISAGFYRLASSFVEVCHYPSISSDSNALRQNLDKRVFGQPFVSKVVVPLINLHISGQSQNKKALVLSFHGTQGSGKNHVAKIIAESIYAEGMKSKFVHLFKPIVHFWGQSPDAIKTSLRDLVASKVRSCDKQLFIFDEVNDMPEGVLEAIHGFIDYSPKFGGLDFSNCIFIFLSNLAMFPINQKFLEMWTAGTKSRDSLEHDTFTKIIIAHSFNENGGFKKCKLITSRLIDAFVPFLPLERSHVESCIKVLAEEYTTKPLEAETISEIVKKVDFVPEGLNLFSSDGCKNLGTPVKLALIMHQYPLKDEL